MNRSAPAIAPLFRSEQQLRILGLLFGDGAHDITIGEVAQRAGVAQATASREVARLAEHGLVVTRSLGRNTLVSANWELPWARELASILMQTVGVLGRLANALADVDGVVEAYVFGSWAARYSGEAGPPPRDIDVAVIGGASLRSIRQAVRDVERELAVDVNPVVIERKRWAAKKPDAFVQQLRARPLVPIPLPAA